MSKLFVASSPSGMSYFCRETGNTRQVETCNMFSGPAMVTEVEVERFEIVHPDDVKPGMEVQEVPEWISSRPCGVGVPQGTMWI